MLDKLEKLILGRTFFLRLSINDSNDPNSNRLACKIKGLKIL